MRAISKLVGLMITAFIIIGSPGLMAAAHNTLRPETRKQMVLQADDSISAIDVFELASPDSMFYYGWLTDDLAYMRIRRFPNKEILEQYIDTIISEIAGARSLIIDIRGNPGGNGFGVSALGSRFADTKRLYEKNNPKRQNQFMKK